MTAAGFTEWRQCSGFLEEHLASSDVNISLLINQVKKWNKAKKNLPFLALF